MESSNYPLLKSAFLIYGTFFMILCLPFLICGAGIIYIYVEEQLPIDLAKREANHWLNNTYDELSQISEDELILEKRPSVWVEGTLVCVYGGASQEYKSNHSHEKVIYEYSQWFQENNWEQSLIDPTRFIYSDDKTLKTATISFQEGLVTHYQITLTFGEKRCIGG